MEIMGICLIMDNAGFISSTKVPLLTPQIARAAFSNASVTAARAVLGFTSELRETLTTRARFANT